MQPRLPWLTCSRAVELHDEQLFREALLEFGQHHQAAGDFSTVGHIRHRSVRNRLDDLRKRRLTARNRLEHI